MANTQMTEEQMRLAEQLARVRAYRESHDCPEGHHRELLAAEQALEWALMGDTIMSPLDYIKTLT